MSKYLYESFGLGVALAGFVSTALEVVWGINTGYIQLVCFGVFILYTLGLIHVAQQKTPDKFE